MDAITLFKQAAVALQSDPRFSALNAARKANDEDAELQAMIQKFQTLNVEYEQLPLGNEDERARLVELQKEMNSIYGTVMSNPNMIAYREAQAEAEKLCGFLDRIIVASMNGEDPMLVQEEESGCSGSCGGCCSSCGGCG